LSRFVLTGLLALLVAAAVPPVAPATGQEKPSPAPPSASAKKLPQGALALVNGEAITQADFQARLLRKEAGTPEMETVLSQIADNHLVLQETKKRKIEIGDADLDRKVASLDEQVKVQSQGKTTLAAELEKTEISMAEFRRQLRTLIALEAMARADFGIAKSEEVPSARLNLWLAQARGKATIKKEGLPDGVSLAVNGEPVYAEEVAREITKAIGKARARSILNEMIGMRLVQMRMKELSVAVTGEDIEREFVARQKQFEKNPRFAGIDYAQYLQATRSQTPEQMKADEEFATQVGIKKIVLAQYSEKDLEKQFEENRDLYGPLTRARHVLVKATEKDGAGGRSFEEAKVIIDKIQAEISKGADFAAVASKESEDTSRLQGGDVGFFPPKGVMDEAFAAAAARLAVGEISPPVRSAAGWHLIQVTERKPEPKFEEVREEVLTTLSRRVYKELIQKAEITVES
jgi:parvulin-like peptidyl-prolyl isomerase